VVHGRRSADRIGAGRVSSGELYECGDGTGERACAGALHDAGGTPVHQPIKSRFVATPPQRLSPLLRADTVLAASAFSSFPTVAFERFRVLREPRINAILSAARAEAEAASQTGVMAAGLSLAAGLMPMQVKADAVERMIAFDVFKQLHDIEGPK
jgi:hypothetical protein